MDWFDLAEKLSPIVRAGDTQTAITHISEQLAKIPKSPFHLVLDLEFTNEPAFIARHLERFVAQSSNELKVIYGEANGFYINPDRWFLNWFGYRTYGGHESYDWLSDWDEGPSEDLTLTGMEPLQKVYASEIAGSDEFSDANDFCTLMIVAKFQDLIRRVTPHMTSVSIPILATAHDFDFIAEISR